MRIWFGLGLGAFFGCRRFWGFDRVGEIEVAPATFAELDICAPHQGHDGSERHLHVAGGADLVAHNGDAFFSARPQTVVVAEDLQGDFSA